MKKILIIAVLSAFLGSAAWAQSIQDRRRVEEEKRKDLSASEFYLPYAGPVSPPEVQTDPNAYFAQLLEKKVAGLSDAYRVLVILTGADDQLKSDSARFDFLNKEGIIPKRIAKAPDYNAPLRKGAAAYMFVKTMDIAGGITMRLFGVSERYAFKELVYKDVMYPGNVRDVMSGAELIVTLTQAADFMARREEIKGLGKGAE